MTTVAPAVHLVTTEYRLTAADRRTARLVAYAQLGDTLAARRPAMYGGRPDIGQTIDGASAEVAWRHMTGAGLAGWDWCAKLRQASGYSAPDVADWEVRSTRYPDGHLLAHPLDDPAARLVLILANGVRFRAVGWITGADAKRPEWWRNPGRRAGGACWCVPQSALHPFA